MFERNYFVLFQRTSSVDIGGGTVEQVLEEVTEVNEVQPQITIEQEVDENIISSEAAEGDTYVIDSNAAEDDNRRGYYLSEYPKNSTRRVSVNCGIYSE